MTTVKVDSTPEIFSSAEGEYASFLAHDAPLLVSQVIGPRRMWKAAFATKLRCTGYRLPTVVYERTPTFITYEYGKGVFHKDCGEVVISGTKKRRKLVPDVDRMAREDVAAFHGTLKPEQKLSIQSFMLSRPSVITIMSMTGTQSMAGRHFLR